MASDARIDFGGSDDDLFELADAGPKRPRMDRLDWERYPGMFSKGAAKTEMLVLAPLQLSFYTHADIDFLQE